MVRKTENKKDTNKEKIFKTWADSYEAVSKMWEDSYLNLYKPLIETTGEMFEKAALLSKEATPEKYREFYDEWIKTYQNTVGKPYQIPTLKSNKEMLEKFLSRAEESNELFKSWITRLEENSRKTREIFQGKADPEKYGKCYEMWTNSYEQIFDEFFELSAKSRKEIFGDYKEMPDICMTGFLQMSKLMKRSYSQMCGPMNESMMKLSGKMTKISMGNATPEDYKEFYTLWMETYNEIYGKYRKSNELSGEMFKNFTESTNIFLSMYKSWITALEDMSEKIKEMSEQTSDPETYKEFCKLWAKTYETAFDSFFDDMPTVEGPMKEVMEPLKMMAKTYVDTFINMPTMMIQSGPRSASAYPGKNKR